MCSCFYFKITYLLIRVLYIKAILDTLFSGVKALLCPWVRDATKFVFNSNDPEFYLLSNTLAYKITSCQQFLILFSCNGYNQ